MISYSQCWEDTSLMLKALQISENDEVLSITSGGCNTIAIAMQNPSIVYSVDINSAQNYLLELKMVALQNLPFDQVLRFLGYRNCSNRIDIYQLIGSNLSVESGQFWDKNTHFIQDGIVHCGKFEKYLNTFRSYILPLVHSQKRRVELVSPKSKEAQKTFYRNKWNSFRWKILFKLFFNKWVMSDRGRTKQMFAHSKSKSVAAIPGLCGGGVRNFRRPLPGRGKIVVCTTGHFLHNWAH